MGGLKLQAVLNKRFFFGFKISNVCKNLITKEIIYIDLMILLLYMVNSLLCFTQHDFYVLNYKSIFI